MSTRLEFTRGAALAFALHVGAMGVAFGVQIAYARWMTTEAFGIYAQALAAMIVTANLLVIGIPMVNLQLLPVFVERRDWARVYGLMGWGMRRVAALAGIAGLFWAMAGAVQGLDAAWSIAGLLVLPTAVVAVQQTQALGFKRVFLARGPSEIGRPLLALGLFGLLVSVGSAPTASVAMVALLIATGLVTGMLAGRIRLLPPADAREVEPAIDHHDWQERTAQFFGHGFFAMVLDRADLLLVGWYLGAEAAAVYAVVISVGKLLTFALASVNTIAAPMVSDLHEQGRLAEVQDVLRLGVGASAALAVVGGLVLFGLSEWVLSWFGPAYTTGATALWICLIGYAVNALAGSAGLVVSMAGHQRITWRVVGLAAAILLGLDMWLIPEAGIVGAAAARSAAMAFWNVVLAVYARRELGLDPSVFAWASRGR